MENVAPQGDCRRVAVDRRFVAILALSLLLHGSLFAAISWQRQPAWRELPRLIASLRVVDKQTSGPPAASAPAPVAEVPQKVRQQRQARENRSSPALMTAAGPTTAPAVVPAVTAAEPVAEIKETAPAASIRSSTAMPIASADEASAADLLAGYRQRLTTLFARQQVYPRIAALRGWEGEVRLRLKVARKGNLLGVALDRSSGFAVLDEHALAMLASLGGLPPLPEALDSQEIQIIVPINYRLQKTT